MPFVPFVPFVLQTTEDLRWGDLYEEYNVNLITVGAPTGSVAW